MKKKFKDRTIGKIILGGRGFIKALPFVGPIVAPILDEVKGDGKGEVVSEAGSFKGSDKAAMIGAILTAILAALALFGVISPEEAEWAKGFIDN